MARLNGVERAGAHQPRAHGLHDALTPEGRAHDIHVGPDFALVGRAAGLDHADHLERAVLAHLHALTEVHALEAATDGAADHALVGARAGLAALDDLRLRAGTS